MAKRKPDQKAFFNRQLTDRQERFCILYVLTGKPSEAYRQAGYPLKRDAGRSNDPDNAVSAIAAKMLNNTRIKRRIAFLKARHGPQTKEDLLKFLGFVITSPSDGLPRVSDQVRATEIIARLNGFFEAEKVEVGLSKGLTSYLSALRGNNFGERVLEMRQADAIALPGHEAESTSVDNQ